ncbi:MAG: conjugal transfer protein TraM [Legionella sp.]|uniref:conjugal transfer protein TraM n=1 Tax=Legionella sp. TaxID=459 RepID=UPI0039E52993
MSEEIDELIKEVAVKHGISLGKDDPILILQTINEKLIVNNKKAHQDMLQDFKEELENISARWKDDAKDKSEKVLNAALISSKEMMAKLVQQSTAQAVEAIQLIMNNAITEIKEVELRTKNYSIATFMVSGVILISFMLVVAFYFF